MTYCGLCILVVSFDLRHEDVRFFIMHMAQLRCEESQVTTLPYETSKLNEVTYSYKLYMDSLHLCKQH